MSTLAVRGLHARIASQEILRGVDLEVRSGEVHALMGPNGSGKSTLSHTLMGRSEYTVTSGSVTIDGEELLGMPTWQRAALGLFVAMQYPVEVPGVRLQDFMVAAVRGRGGDPDPVALGERLHHEARRLGVADEFLTRGINDEFSGGEKKRLETLQLAVLEPKFAILDEIDSGLDIDALRIVSRGVNALRRQDRGILLVTHYKRLLEYCRPDFVHVMAAGRIVRSGGPELAEELERTGYAWVGDPKAETQAAGA
jgi:Fe-S cluster assembly ATP-binding protein